MWSILRPISVAILQCLLILKCGICTWVEIISCSCGGKCTTFYWQGIFCVLLQEQEDCFWEIYGKSGNRLPDKTIHKNVEGVFWTMRLKTEIFLSLYKRSKKGDSMYEKWQFQSPENKRMSFYGNILWQWPSNVDGSVNREKFAAPKSFSIFYTQLTTNKSFLPATNVLSQRRTPNSLDFYSLEQANLYWLCGIRKRSGQIWTTSWSKIDSKYLDLKVKVFLDDDNNCSRLDELSRLGEADVNRFLRLRKQLIVAAEKLSRVENLSPVSTPTQSNHRGE